MSKQIQDAGKNFASAWRVSRTSAVASGATLGGNAALMPPAGSGGGTPTIRSGGGGSGGRRFRVVSPVFQYDGKDIVIVETSVGRQAFYRSDGQYSNSPGTWFPFDEVLDGAPWRNYFNKLAYTDQSGFTAGHPLHRFGLEEFKEASRYLGSLVIPEGGAIKKSVDVNQVLDFFGVRRSNFTLARRRPNE